MFRAVTRRQVALLTTIAAASTTVALSSRPIYLDAPAPSPITPLPSSSPKRLPIYPTSDPEIVLEEVHTDLERQIGSIREQGTIAYIHSRAVVQTAVSKWIGVEEAVENKVKEIVPKDEPLTPGILYIGVAALAGSVFARNRSLPVRFLLPPTLLLVAFPRFLPKTSANLRQFFASLEDTYAPSVSAQHEELKKSLATLTKEAKETYARLDVNTRKSLEDGLKKIEEVSGLKVGVAKSGEAAPTSTGAARDPVKEAETILKVEGK